jgi:hypothetical protein
MTTKKPIKPTFDEELAAEIQDFALPELEAPVAVPTKAAKPARRPRGQKRRMKKKLRWAGDV